MNSHKLARLTPLGRARMVQRLEAGQSVAQVARELDLSTTTVRRWWRRYQADGVAGLEDRSSRPHRSPRALPRYRRRQILRLRHQRRSSLQIAAALGLPLATVVHIQPRRPRGLPACSGARSFGYCASSRRPVPPYSPTFCVPCHSSMTTCSPWLSAPP